MVQEADAKKIVQERRQTLAKAQEEGIPKGKPTPTQDELDLAMMGVPIEKHEDDGSGPELQLTLTRQAHPERTGAAHEAQQHERPQQPRQPTPPRTNPQS